MSVYCRSVRTSFVSTLSPPTASQASSEAAAAASAALFDTQINDKVNTHVLMFAAHKFDTTRLPLSSILITLCVRGRYSAALRSASQRRSHAHRRTGECRGSTWASLTGRACWLWCQVVPSASGRGRFSTWRIDAYRSSKTPPPTLRGNY